MIAAAVILLHQQVDRLPMRVIVPGATPAVPAIAVRVHPAASSSATCLRTGAGT